MKINSHGGELDLLGIYLGKTSMANTSSTIALMSRWR